MLSLNRQPCLFLEAFDCFLTVSEQFVPLSFSQFASILNRFLPLLIYVGQLRLDLLLHRECVGTRPFRIVLSPRRWPLVDCQRPARSGRYSRRCRT